MIIVFPSFSDTSTSADWTLRHGRGSALSVALKVAAVKLWTDQYKTGVKKAVSTLTEADRVKSILSLINHIDLFVSGQEKFHLTYRSGKFCLMQVV